MGPWTTDALGETNGTFAFTAAASLSVALNAAVSPVLGAMSDRTGGRKRYPGGVHDRLHRADPGDRPGQHLARPAVLRHRQLRLPGRADLLRRAAPRRRAAGRPRKALRRGRGARLRGQHRLRPAARHHHRRGREHHRRQLPAHRLAVRGLRHPDLRHRPRARSASEAPSARPRHCSSWSQLRITIGHARQRPGCCAS